MSISSEITSIGENLKKDYQSIANLGADLTNVDKNIENIAELLDGVYDRLPKTEFEEGESVTLENTLKGKLDYDDGKVGFGQASQKTTNGYQLLDLKNYTETIGGVTITIQDGIITLNGTANAYTTRVISQNPTSALTGTYNLNYEYVSGTMSSYANINLYNGSSEPGSTTFTNESRNTDITLSNEAVSTRMYFSNNCVFNNYKIKPMLYSGSYDSNKHFEKYTGGQASPNPSYPQEIKCVTGNQDVVVSGKNLFEPVLVIDGTNIGVNNSSLTQVINGEFSFVASGSDLFFGNVRNEGATYEKSRGIKIYRNGNSKISYRCSNDSFNKNFFTAYDKSDISLGYTMVGSGGTGTYTFPDNCEYVTFRFGNGSAVSGATYKTKVILAYGDTIPDYEPYITPTSYQLSLGDIELNAIGNYKDELIYDVDEDKVYKNEVIKEITGTELMNISSFQNSSAYTDDTYLCCFNNAMQSTQYVNTKLYCNYFQGDYHYAIQKVANNLHMSASSLGICVLKSDFANVSALNDWWNNNGSKIKIYNVLRTPTKTEITGTLKGQIKALYNAHSLNGTTIIISNGNLPMIIKVRGLKGE